MIFDSQKLKLLIVISFVAVFLVTPGNLLGDDHLAGSDQSGIDFFETNIRPVLIEHCYECHSLDSGESSGSLRLDSRSAMVRGGVNGAVIDIEQPVNSILLKAIEFDDADLQMPPSGKLSEATLVNFRHWLEMGAPDPRTETTQGPLPDQRQRITKQANSHWSYQVLKQPAVPVVANQAWGKSELDSFVIAKLETAGMKPSPEARSEVLIRRLYHDLIGLPPSFEQIQQFQSDNDSDRFALEKLVDQLLESEHYGERMARRWMDVVRYADTKGYVFQEDRNYPYAYRYRDWLIQAFNRSLPYDQFIRFQLAADQLDPKNESGDLDAMGMLTLGRRFLNNKQDIADDRIDVVTRGLMGMTVGCARCHDHKFDPVTMSDYYSLQGVFLNSEEPGDEPSPLRLIDRPSQQPSFILLRGQPGNRGKKIKRQFIRFLSPEEGRPLETGSGRLELADAITERTNPLTARVFVNRVWMWLMGTPLVDSPSDFGLQCEVPVHQSLLDHLSLRLMESEWDVKQLVREIVTSSTYRQSSQSREESLAIDPLNQLWWRANRRRMEFESFRDALLVAAGDLDRTIGGPSVVIHEQPFVPRRTLYAHIDRQNLPGLFRAFDVASPDTHSPKRAVTSVPQQGLFILNNEFVLDIAVKLGETAQQHQKTAGDELAIEWLFKQVLGRLPTALERNRSAQFINTDIEPMPDSTGPVGLGVWAVFAQALLTTNEFCFVD